ncbi:MAG: methyl-accepting chemotaxis protein [Spirochaetes bacterium]|nr:methyl-accepting chemotaxis protein [Spirochaetota bacterium]
MKKNIVFSNFIVSTGVGLITAFIASFIFSFFITFPSAAVKWAIIGISSFAGFLAGVVNFFYMRSTVLSAVRTITEEMRIMAAKDGDLTRRVTYVGDDMIGELVRSFNAFSDRVSVLVRAMQKILKLSRSQRALLSKSMEQAVTAVERITATVTEVKSVYEEQHKEVASNESSLSNFYDSVLVLMTNTVELIEQMKMLTAILRDESTAVEDIMQRISDMASSMSLIATLSNEADSYTANLTGISKDGLTQVQATGVALKSARESTEKVRLLVEGISEIANKTNTLSVNAAIEAVRAGAAGRGFGVVSGEIRKLADNASSMVSDAQGVLDEIVMHIEDCSTKMNASEKRFTDVNEGITHLAGIVNKVRTGNETSRESAQSFSKSTGLIKDLSGSIKERYTDVHEMLVTIRTRLVELNIATRESVASMKRLVTLSSTVSAATDGMNEQANDVTKVTKRVLRELKDADTWIADLDVLAGKYSTGETHEADR